MFCPAREEKIISLIIWIKLNYFCSRTLQLFKSLLDLSNEFVMHLTMANLNEINIDNIKG
jgi:hypothetical protein